MTQLYWCELAWLGGDATDAGVAICVEGDRIAWVEPGIAAPPSHATVLRGLTLPGFANAHSHAFHRAFRGRTHTGAGTFWSWREQMYAVAARLDPDLYLDLATAVYAEMVQAGFTAVGEFHYVHHAAGGVRYSNPNAMSEALIEAARRAGLRITLLDTCYLQGGIAADGRSLPVEGVQQRYDDGSVQEWIDRVGAMPAMMGETAMIGAAVHSVRAVPPEAIEQVAAWCLHHDRVLHAHVSEQPLENEQSIAAYGRTPTQLLAGAGALDAPFTAVHATHLSDADIAAFGAHGCSCCICPTTERDLADGIGLTTELRSAGAGLCIGTDAHSSIDPFEEMRAVELDERLRSLHRGTYQPAQLLAIGSANGYASLGWAGGSLSAGDLADFVTLRLDSPRLAGTSAEHALGSVVFGAAPTDVTDVFVGGRRIVSDGRHGSIDVSAALTEAIRRVFA